VLYYSHEEQDNTHNRKDHNMKTMNTNQYIDFIRTTIETEGYKVADTANKLALEMKKITTSQYSEAARLIAAAFLQVCSIALMNRETLIPDKGVVRVDLFHWPAIALAAVIFLCLRYTPLKKLHPVAFIALAAVIGILFKM